jgi:hypothetical protein
VYPSQVPSPQTWCHNWSNLALNTSPLLHITDQLNYFQTGLLKNVQ